MVKQTKPASKVRAANKPTTAQRARTTTHKNRVVVSRPGLAERLNPLRFLPNNRGLRLFSISFISVIVLCASFIGYSLYQDTHVFAAKRTCASGYIMADGPSGAHCVKKKAPTKSNPTANKANCSKGYHPSSNGRSCIKDKKKEDKKKDEDKKKSDQPKQPNCPKNYHVTDGPSGLHCVPDKEAKPYTGPACAKGYTKTVDKKAAAGFYCKKNPPANKANSDSGKVKVTLDKSVSSSTWKGVEKDCEALGRFYSGGKCYNQCRSGEKITAGDVYNYCTKSVSKMTQASCDKQGRKFVVTDSKTKDGFCAKSAQQGKAGTVYSAGDQKQCSDPKATYVVDTKNGFDYCTKATATKAYDKYVKTHPEVDNLAKRPAAKTESGGILDSKTLQKVLDNIVPGDSKQTSTAKSTETAEGSVNPATLSSSKLQQQCVAKIKDPDLQKLYCEVLDAPAAKDIVNVGRVRVPGTTDFATVTLVKGKPPKVPDCVQAPSVVDYMSANAAINCEVQKKTYEVTSKLYQKAYVKDVKGNDYQDKCRKYTGVYAAVCNGQCVSFVLTRLYDNGAISKDFWQTGNGGVTAKNVAKALKRPVSSIPTLHAVASKYYGNPAGHTMMVSGVNRDGNGKISSIEIEETNFDVSRGYGTRTIPAPANGDWKAAGWEFANTSDKYQIDYTDENGSTQYFTATK